MDLTLPTGSDREDSLVALVLWRLHDPAWNPSFVDLLEDARTCADPKTEAATLLAALRTVVTSDAALAPRARTLAVQAQRLMAARCRSRSGGSEPEPPRSRRLGALRAPLFRT
ncbi:hypothetical protein C6569_08865 [Phreatobacter cathodiphilus]|uniref:Uncharacterized protein n=1 Tax=Phreatobacter cathodiphilus TaxID=1868589 RepID=A0A2S0NB44_9HYPH|nr:hypothetical protein C6569_08865 [Phreatobacter cathodiphilus]